MNIPIPETYNLTSRILPSKGPCVSGPYTEVKKCGLKDSDKLVAVKSYKSMLDDPSDKIHPELWLLSSRLPPHDNVVQFLGFRKDKLFHSLVMPWMADGTLTSFIRTHGPALEISAKTTLLHDISSGLEYLHFNFVIHGNLESDNILITERHSACISGFRQSVRLSSRDAACPQSQMPPKPAIQFAGPEWFARSDDAIFQNLPKTLFKSDIYSLGCVMFYVFATRKPWDGIPSVEISNQLLKRVTPSRPNGSIVNDKQWALIKPCLLLLPQDRPVISSVLKKIKDYLVFIGTPDLTGQIEKGDKLPISGGYGSVYESIWNRRTGGRVKVAVKVMRIQGDLRIDEVKKNLKRELAAWRRLSHMNIVLLLGTTTGFGPLEGMVSPWMKNGSLHVFLGTKKDVPLSKRRRWVKDIAEGLKYLHEHPIVHGDLTSSNVLIDDGEKAVLTDFGLSVILGGFTNLSVTYTDAKTGSPGWAAPELFPDAPCSKGPSPSPQSDVYSFACLMHMIFTGFHLWNITGIHAEWNTITRVRTGERPTNPGTIDTQYWNLIEECWAQSPSSRPKISDVLLRLGNMTSVQT
ncbi:kinase-like domain-containing protein [Suillus occidentalis]|nr:kinase-like domain-containing protein [Suillus occidentalis]